MDLRGRNKWRVRGALQFFLVFFFSTCLQDCTVISRAVAGGGALGRHSQGVNLPAFQLV